jgi:hypothetical protein
VEVNYPSGDYQFPLLTHYTPNNFCNLITNALGGIMNKVVEKAKKFYAKHDTKVKVAAGVLAGIAIQQVLSKCVDARAFESKMADQAAYIAHEKKWSLANPDKQEQVRDTWNAYKSVCDENGLKYFLD